MKVADIKLTWKKSVSADVAKVKLYVTIAGQTTTTEFGPEVEEAMTEVKAMQSCQFRVESIDSEGLMSLSMVHDFTLGDLEAPAPATDLDHMIVGIRDV